MTESFRKVDYRIRQEKHTERRMIVQMLQRVSQVFPIEQYQYIGFGSIYFSDFILFHKVLGISRMTSIEDTTDTKRFDFNKPYSFIEMVYQHSSKALPGIDWSTPSILWLDYDGVLGPEVMADIGVFIQKAVSRSILLVTVNAEPERGSSDWFSERVGQDLAEPFDRKDLASTKFPATCLKVMRSVVDLSLLDRNGTAPKPVAFRSLANLEYKDGAAMVTMAGILLNEDDAEQFSGCKLEDLDFVQEDSPFRIFVPKLTPAERRAIDALIPDLSVQRTKFLGIPHNDIERYQKVYRYAPLYADVEV